ncbi:hypothetical protein [Actinomyces weissii]|uniref:Uncharacterized protein n=1 Tax=Actinomyces weissii TaxID=675090 RepID=A0A7T7S1F5_9ACTO|nr:hypothetical protein [Actinomyces weissii]QQM66582.1 hypothetical protein JG540_05500 [Actinomyces weissii]
MAGLLGAAGDPSPTHVIAWQQAASENAAAYQALLADLAPPDLATTHGTLGALKAITTTWPAWQAPAAHAPQGPVAPAAPGGLGACVGRGLVTLWPRLPLVGWAARELSLAEG